MKVKKKRENLLLIIIIKKGYKRNPSMFQEQCQGFHCRILHIIIMLSNGKVGVMAGCNLLIFFLKGSTQSSIIENDNYSYFMEKQVVGASSIKNELIFSLIMQGTRC